MVTEQAHAFASLIAKTLDVSFKIGGYLWLDNNK